MVLIIPTYLTSFLFPIKDVRKQAPKETAVSSGLLGCHGSDILLHQSAASWLFFPVNFAPETVYSGGLFPLFTI